MGPVDVSLTNYWSKIYPSCRPAARAPDLQTQRCRGRLSYHRQTRALVPRSCQTTKVLSSAAAEIKADRYMQMHMCIHVHRLQRAAWLTGLRGVT